MNKYSAWKAKKSTCDPIPGTDRVLLAKSARKALNHLADEEGVKYYGQCIVRCKNGDFWTVQILERNYNGRV